VKGLAARNLSMRLPWIPIDSRQRSMRQLRFIRESPWSDFPIFSASFLRLSEASPAARQVDPGVASQDLIARLRGVLQGVMLRRTTATRDAHGAPILSLPRRRSATEALAFDELEQDFYSALLQRSQTRFDAYLSAGKASPPLSWVWGEEHRGSYRRKSPFDSPAA